MLRGYTHVRRGQQQQQQQHVGGVEYIKYGGESTASSCWLPNIIRRKGGGLRRNQLSPMAENWSTRAPWAEMREAISMELGRIDGVVPCQLHFVSLHSASISSSHVFTGRAGGPTAARNMHPAAAHAQPANYDAAQEPQLPLELKCNVTVLSLGQVVTGPDADKYWTEARLKDQHAYPVGYQASKVYNGVRYLMSIAAGESGPVFQVRRKDKRKWEMGTTPTEAWMRCLEAEGRAAQRVNGRLFFGFTQPELVTLLQKPAASAGRLASKSSPKSPRSKTAVARGSEEEERGQSAESGANSGNGDREATGARGRRSMAGGAMPQEPPLGGNQAGSPRSSVERPLSSPVERTSSLDRSSIQRRASADRSPTDRGADDRDDGRGGGGCGGMPWEASGGSPRRQSAARNNNTWAKGRPSANGEVLEEEEEEEAEEEDKFFDARPWAESDMTVEESLAYERRREAAQMAELGLALEEGAVRGGDSSGGGGQGGAHGRGRKGDGAVRGGAGGEWGGKEAGSGGRAEGGVHARGSGVGAMASGKRVTRQGGTSANDHGAGGYGDDDDGETAEDAPTWPAAASFNGADDRVDDDGDDVTEEEDEAGDWNDRALAPTGHPRGGLGRGRAAGAEEGRVSLGPRSAQGPGGRRGRASAGDDEAAAADAGSTMGDGLVRGEEEGDGIGGSAEGTGQEVGVEPNSVEGFRIAISRRAKQGDRLGALRMLYAMGGAGHTVDDAAICCLFPFELDVWQKNALRQLADNDVVMLEAPAGAGKSTVADFVMYRQLAAGGRVLLVSPLKLLATQRFRTLQQAIGPESVGALWGSTRVNVDAPVLVVTVDTLRELALAEKLEGKGLVARWPGGVASHTSVHCRLTSFAVAVLDEFHTVGDRNRGSMWQETVLHLPRSLQLLCLLVPHSDADLILGWLRSVHGSAALVSCTTRPVPQNFFYCKPGGLHQLLSNEGDVNYALRASGPFVRPMGGASTALASGTMSPSSSSLSSPSASSNGPFAPSSRGRSGFDAGGQGANGSATMGPDEWRDYGADDGEDGEYDALGDKGVEPGRRGGFYGGGPGYGPEGGSRRGSGGFDGGGPSGQHRRPNLRFVLWQLHKRGMMPAMFFIFSREGCSSAIKEAARIGTLSLVTEEEAARIRAKLRVFLDQHPGYARQDEVAPLLRGIAAHHAGVLPEWRYLVEDLCAEGLIKLVFGTESLAAGLRIFVRTVVISSVSKKGGTGHRLLLSSEFQRLAVRAGRRGLDPAGNVVVLQTPYAGPEDVVSLIHRGQLTLQAIFKPGYSPLLNMLQLYTLSELEAVVASSLSHFSASKKAALATGGVKGVAGGSSGGPSSMSSSSSSAPAGAALSRPREGDGDADVGGECVFPGDDAAGAAVGGNLGDGSGMIGGIDDTEVTLEDSPAFLKLSAAIAQQEAAVAALEDRLRASEVSRAEATQLLLERSRTFTFVQVAWRERTRHVGVLLAEVPGSVPHYVCLCADNRFRMVPASCLLEVYSSLPRLNEMLEVRGEPPVEVPTMPMSERWVTVAVDGGTDGFEAVGERRSGVVADAIRAVALATPELNDEYSDEEGEGEGEYGIAGASGPTDFGGTVTRSGLSRAREQAVLQQALGGARKKLTALMARMQALKRSRMGGKDGPAVVSASSALRERGDARARFGARQGAGGANPRYEGDDEEPEDGMKRDENGGATRNQRAEGGGASRGWPAVPSPSNSDYNSNTSGSSGTVPLSTVLKELEPALRVLEVAGAVRPAQWDEASGGTRMKLTSLGETAAALRTDNELWAAQVLLSGALDGLAPADMAGVIATLVTEETRGNRNKTRGGGATWSTEPLGADVEFALQEIRDLRIDMIQLQRLHNVRIPILFDQGPVALARAWALGAQWDDLRNYTSLDEGDVVQVLRMTVHFLSQVAELDTVNKGVAAKARVATELMSRFPVSENFDADRGGR
eukprot:jgi/Mesvir1/4355/Mv02438-RA.1